MKDPATGQTVDAATGKPVKKDPVSGKIVDAASGKPVEQAAAEDAAKGIFPS